MINKVNLISNNNLSFKSTFRADEKLEHYLGQAKNQDLLEFYQTLKLLNKDGNGDEYFLSEGVYKFYNHTSKFQPLVERPEIILMKRNNEDYRSSRVESIIIGGHHLETAPKDVIAELTRILKRKLDYTRTDVFRNNVMNKIREVLK